jgi:hypothetical protein
MSELEESADSESSHRIDPNAYFLEIYRLLCHVLASAAISEVQRGFRRNLFNTAFQRSEISRLLIHVATYYRVKYDDGSWEHAPWLHEQYEGVGVLVDDVEQPDASRSLAFREACNKVIHAKRVNFDGSPDSEESIGALNATVHLYGERLGRQWKAQIDLVEFCRAASNVIV